MAQGFVQHWDVPAQAAEYLHVPLGVFHLCLHHVVDEVLIAGPLRTAEQQLHRLPVGTDVIHHPVDTARRLHAHVLRLLLLRQLGEGGLGRHELPHEGGGMGLHDRGEQGLLAGKIAVEGAGGHPGILHDLPQGGPLEAFIQEFRHSGLLNFFQCGNRCFFHWNLSCNIVI